MKNFRVIVYLNEDCKTANKRIFERYLPAFNADVYVDFNSLVSSLCFLFGSSCIVVFELS